MISEVLALRVCWVLFVLASAQNGLTKHEAGFTKAKCKWQLKA